MEVVRRPSNPDIARRHRLKKFIKKIHPSNKKHLKLTKRIKHNNIQTINISTRQHDSNNKINPKNIKLTIKQTQ